MKRIIYLSLLALIITSCNEEIKPVKKPSTTKVKVITENVKLQSNEKELKYSGSVEAWKTIPIHFQIPGIIEEIFVEEGQQVKQDQLLAIIDDSDAKNSYAISKAKREQAEDAHSRLKKVYEQGSLPEIKWVEILTQLSQANSLAEISKSNLEKCRLLSPIDGYIGRRNIEPGMSSIHTATPFEIVEIDKVFIKISVPENEIGIIKHGQNANILVRALGNQEFVGTVENIGIVANKFSRTYEVKLLVENNDIQLKPGMVCDVNLNVGPQKEALVVSAKSISVNEKGETFVYLINKRKDDVIQKQVSIGKYINNYVEILDGLAEGDIIVKEGKEKLSGEYKLSF